MFGPQKARFIIPGETSEQDSPLIECMFNPEQCVFAAQRTVTRADQTSAVIPVPSGTILKPATLTLKLVFDTYETGEDVRVKYTDKLWLRMLPPGAAAGAPTVDVPEVTFLWGRSWTFRGVITSMTQTFTLFLTNGNPARANVDLTMEQTKAAALEPENSPGTNWLKQLAWTVTQGQSLAWIAGRALGDVNQGRKIASANSLDSLRDLAEGTTLEIDLG